MPQPPPTDGQFFTLQPVAAPKPTSTHWGLPLAIGLLAIPLLMFGFGFSQQQTPAPAVSATATPSASPEAPPVTATPQTAPTPAPSTAPSSDPVTLPIAHIQSPGMAANFRAAPSLHSQVLGVWMDGDLVELTPDRRVQQDGVIWVPVRWRGQAGWLASNFLGASNHAQP